MRLVTPLVRGTDEIISPARGRFSTHLASLTEQFACDAHKDGLIHLTPRCANFRDKNLLGEATAVTIEQKALGLLKAFERAGREVNLVTVDGRKIELVLSKEQENHDEFAAIDMRHGEA